MKQKIFGTNLTIIIIQLDSPDPEVNVVPFGSTRLIEGESIVIACDYNGVDIVSVNWIFMNRYTHNIKLGN